MFRGGRKESSFLDHRKGIVFAQLLTDYTEWCRVLELAVIEASENQGVPSVESAADIRLARECTTKRLLCPELVHIQQHTRMVHKTCDNLSNNISRTGLLVLRSRGPMHMSGNCRIRPLVSIFSSCGTMNETQ